MVQLLHTQAVMSCYHKHSRKGKRKWVRITLWKLINLLLLFPPRSCQKRSSSSKHLQVKSSHQIKAAGAWQSWFADTSLCFYCNNRSTWEEKNIFQLSLVKDSSCKDRHISKYEAALGKAGHCLAQIWEKTASKKGNTDLCYCRGAFSPL